MTQQRLNEYWQHYLADPDSHRHSLFLAVRSYALAVLRREPDAEDLAQQATWKIWATWCNVPITKTFGHWAYLIIQDTARKHHRRNRAVHRAESRVAWAKTEPAFTPEDRERMLTSAGKERSLIEALLRGLTLDEIAGKLGVKTRTIRRRLNVLKVVPRA